MEKEFVYLDEAMPGIRWDAKYATKDNFTGDIVDGYCVNRVIGTRALAEALTVAQRRVYRMGLGLLLWDGYRPQRAVDCFLRWAAQPEDGKTKAKHYPNIDRMHMVTLGYVAKKSGHSRGSAIDLTLYKLDTGELLDMGGDFDLMDISSHHGAAGIPKEAAHNRELLRRVMSACGLSEYACEWWHYSLANEPYPDTYFNFPIDTPRAID